MKSEWQVFWQIFIPFTVIAIFMLYAQGAFYQIDTAGILILVTAYFLCGVAVYCFVKSNRDLGGPL